MAKHSDAELLKRLIAENFDLHGQLLTAQKKLAKFAEIADYLRQASWAEVCSFEAIEKGMPRNQYAFRAGRYEVAYTVFGYLFVDEAGYLVEMTFTYAPSDNLDIEMAQNIELRGWLATVQDAIKKVKNQLYSIYVMVCDVIKKAQQVQNVAPVVWARWQGRLQFARQVKNYLERAWLRRPILDVFI